MSFNLDIFYAAVNQSNPEVSREANEALFNSIPNPELAVFIFNNFLNPEAQKNPNVIQLMSMALYRIVLHIWSLYPDRLNEYSVETANFVRNNLISLYPNTNPQFQIYIIDSLRHIINLEKYQSSDLVQNLCLLINAEQNLHTISFVFQVLESFSSLLKINQNKVNRCVPFCAQFLQFWPIVAPKLQQSFAADNSVDSFQILKSIAIIMNNLIYNSCDALLNPVTESINQFFLNSLLLPNGSKECILMKESILSFFNDCFVTDADKPEKQSMTLVKKFFLDNFVQASYQIFSTLIGNETINALTRLIDIFYNLSFRGIAQEFFFTQDFVFNILIPSARLTPNDLNEFEFSPSQYIGQIISNVSDTDKTDIPRHGCAKIVLQIGPNILQFFSIDFGQFTNPFDLEAFLYLLYQGYSRKDAPPIDEHLYMQIFNLMNSGNLPEFLKPTVLCALNNKLLEGNYELMKTIASFAYFHIMNPEMNIVTSASAIPLLRISIISLAENGDIGSIVNINNLVQRLIQVSTEINYSEVQLTLQNLILSCKGEMIQYSHALFDTIIQMLEEITKVGESNYEQDGESEGIIDTIYTIFDVQTNQNDKQIFLGKIITFTVNVLQNYPGATNVPDLIKLCVDVSGDVDFASCSDEVKAILMNFMHFSFSYLNADEENIYLLPEIGGIFTYMMPFIAEEEVQNIYNFCVQIVQDNEELIISASLVIMAGIILYRNTHITEILQLTLELLKNEIMGGELSSIFISGIYVITAALFATKGQCIQMVPGEVVQQWMENSNIDFLQSKREIHTFCLGLAILANMGNGEAFKVLSDLLTQRWENESDPENEFEIEDDPLSGIITPIDHENVSKLFLDLIGKYSSLDQFPELFINWLRE